MVLSAIFLHVMTGAILLRLIVVLADWSCSADTVHERQGRGMEIIVLLVPFALMALYTNLAPWRAMGVLP